MEKATFIRLLEETLNKLKRDRFTGIYKLSIYLRGGGIGNCKENKEKEFK